MKKISIFSLLIVFVSSVFITNALVAAEKKYKPRIIITADPELDDNNSELTEKNSKGEHVRTLNESMTIRFGNINSDFQWQVFKKSIPYAWDNGKQIFYIGIKK